MRAEEQYGDGGYRCEFFYSSLLTMGGSVDHVLLVRFQMLEVGTMSPLRGRPSRPLSPTTAPLVVEGDDISLRLANLHNRSYRIVPT